MRDECFATDFDLLELLFEKGLKPRDRVNVIVNHLERHTPANQGRLAEFLWSKNMMPTDNILHALGAIHLTEVTRALLKPGRLHSEINRVMEFGSGGITVTTPLISAIIGQASTDYVQLLLQKGADINQSGSDKVPWKTPLGVALWRRAY
jgi:hypothetical protein